LAGPVVGAGEKQIPRFARNDKIWAGSDKMTDKNDTTLRASDPRFWFTVRHSITVTDYTVRVWRMSAPLEVRGEWFVLDRLKRVALTGLARKILRRAGLAGTGGK